MRQVKEISIPVPWGHIAAKAWGDENDPPVLVSHGIMDNAGSFDKLIPLLPEEFYYICFDLPSHGKSSHLPPFLPIHSEDFILAYKFMVNHFKKKSYIFIGHSYGSLIAHDFARLYPQYVQKLIMLDGITLLPFEPEETKDLYVRAFDTAIDVYEKSLRGKKPAYAYKEALERVRNGRLTEITDEVATMLLNRAIESVGNDLYSFTIDQRMKATLDPVQDARYKKESLEAHPSSCPILMLLNSETDARVHKCYPSLEVFQTWERVKIVQIQGDHDVHMKHPERVAGYIGEFLRQTSSKI